MCPCHYLFQRSRDSFPALLRKCAPWSSLHLHIRIHHEVTQTHTKYVHWSCLMTHKVCTKDTERRYSLALTFLNLVTLETRFLRYTHDFAAASAAQRDSPRFIVPSGSARHESITPSLHPSEVGSQIWTDQEVYSTICSASSFTSADRNLLIPAPPNWSSVVSQCALPASISLGPCKSNTIQTRLYLPGLFLAVAVQLSLLASSIVLRFAVCQVLYTEMQSMMSGALQPEPSPQRRMWVKGSVWQIPCAHSSSSIPTDWKEHTRACEMGCSALVCLYHCMVNYVLTPCLTPCSLFREALDHSTSPTPLSRSLSTVPSIRSALHSVAHLDRVAIDDVYRRTSHRNATFNTIT